MPESVECALKAEEIHNYIFEENKRMIIGIEWDKKSRYNAGNKRGEIKGLDLAKLPIVVEKVYSHGKLIILDSVNVKGEQIYLIFHLGMTGKFTYGKNKEKHSNLWLSLGKKVEGKEYYEEKGRIYFNDSRKFGSFSIHKNLSELMKKNGPCLFAASMGKYDINTMISSKGATLEIWLCSLNNGRIRDKPICEFLLEQKHVSGVGNYIRAECLYLAKIHPERKLRDLRDEEKIFLYEKILEVIYLSWKSKGPSSGYIEGGCFALQVYSRESDPLGNPVETYSDSKNRTVHYVPNIQK